MSEGGSVHCKNFINPPINICGAVKYSSFKDKLPRFNN